MGKNTFLVAPRQPQISLQGVLRSVPLLRDVSLRCGIDTGVLEARDECW